MNLHVQCHERSRFRGTQVVMMRRDARTFLTWHLPDEAPPPLFALRQTRGP